MTDTDVGSKDFSLSHRLALLVACKLCYLVTYFLLRHAILTADIQTFFKSRKRTLKYNITLTAIASNSNLSFFTSLVLSSKSIESIECDFSTINTNFHQTLITFQSNSCA